MPALSSRSGNFLLDPDHESYSFLMPREQFTGSLLSRGDMQCEFHISKQNIIMETKFSRAEKASWRLLGGNFK